jgi:hypothetical protein
VGVSQIGEDLSLPEESVVRGGGGEVDAEPLERRGRFELTVRPPGAVDIAHAAAGDELGELPRTDGAGLRERRCGSLLFGFITNGLEKRADVVDAGLVGFEVEGVPNSTCIVGPSAAKLVKTLGACLFRQIDQLVEQALDAFPRRRLRHIFPKGNDLA